MSIATLRKDLLTNFYAKQDAMHDKTHAIRAIGFASALARSSGADETTCVTGALLHQLHDVKLAERYLKRHRINPALRGQVIECLRYRERVSKNGNAIAPFIEAQIVSEADALDTFGVLGTLRIVLIHVINGEMSLKKAIEYAERRAKKKKTLLKTPLARELGKKLQKHMPLFFREARLSQRNP
ncbi:hypothetical protein HY546_03205 [archaeon]|nr:hypothetical protein [archaeon]